MRQLPDHPEIEWALRTGYPSWMQPKKDLDVEDDAQEIEDLGGYHNEDTLYEERREEAYDW